MLFEFVFTCYYCISRKSVICKAQSMTHNCGMSIFQTSHQHPNVLKLRLLVFNSVQLMLPQFIPKIIESAKKTQQISAHLHFL